MALPSPSSTGTCVVTGASSGIGAEVARLLAERGYNLTLAARREDRLRELGDELSGRHGIRADVAVVDVTDPEQRRGLLDGVASRGLVVDVLVNNAGFSTSGAVHRGDPDREVEMIRTNVEAVAHLCALVLPGMVERGRGGILNVASAAAFQPFPGGAAYAASKSFVLSYSHAIRVELRGTGVSVTALCPGPVETEFAQVAGLAGAEDALPRFMWVSAGEVARQGVEALDHDRAVVIPGAANRVAAAAGYLAPRSVLLPLMARQHPALRR